MKEIPHRRSLVPKVLTHLEPPLISIKDAVETVPIFDRTKTSRPMFQFIRACERARSMMPGQHESHLVKLLMNKLRGYAFLAVEDASVTTVNELENKLKNMYASAKTINEYRGELESVFQQ